MDPELKVRKILGKTYLNENRLSDALEVFSKILVDYPDDVETLHILGNFYLASGDGKTAKKIYLRAQQLDPKNYVIQRQIDLADELCDSGIEEPIPTELPAVSRLLQRLTGRKQSIPEEDIMRAAELLDKIVHSDSPAMLVAKHLDEIDELMPALIELNIRQANLDGHPELAESLRTLQVNIGLQLSARDDPAPEPSPNFQSQSQPGYNSNILLLSPVVGKLSARMSLLKSILESFGCNVEEKREYFPERENRPDVVIAGNPHVNPAMVESMTSASAAGIPIILDLDTDFEKQPISHPEYNTKGLGTPARSNAYTSAISLANMVTVPAEAQAESLMKLAGNVNVIPDGWSHMNDQWQKESQPRNTINIGWLGTSGQLEDLVLIRRFIVRIIREFANSRIVLIGNPQSYRLFDSLPENRRLYLPAVDHNEYPYLLGQLDILLVPLRNTPFNITLPDTILMEAGAKGIPWIASSIPSFRHWQRGGVIANSPDEWHLNLRHLVMDAELRRKLGQDGRNAARFREMIQVGKLWLEAINQVIHTHPSALAAMAETSPTYRSLEQ